MNWGYKILAVYGLFVVGIMFMVFKSSNQKMDLVTADYYGKELKYQQVIDQSQRTSELSEALRYEVKDGQLEVVFPKDFAGKKITGNVELYYPADETRDVKKDFSLQDAMFTMPVGAGNKGQYELHINWQADGKDYYFETKIFI
jgi:hypothetical protein